MYMIICFKLRYTNMEVKVWSLENEIMTHYNWNITSSNPYSMHRRLTMNILIIYHESTQVCLKNINYNNL